MPVTNGSLKTSPIGDAPMCSSPADPLSASSSDLMPADRAAFGGAVTARRDAVTDISSKGLLPQLIDVLLALTQGQESLSRKVRDARLEDTCRSTPVAERCPQAEPSDFDALGAFVSTSSNASIELRREHPTDSVDLGTGPTSLNGVANGSLPESSGGVSAAPVSATVPNAASPSNPPAATVTHGGTPADLSSETSARKDWLTSARPADPTTAPLNRDYNFFDELDARLADLQDPADRSEDW